MANFRKNTYATWQQASDVVKSHGVKDRDEYLILYDKIDPFLPSNPQVFYPDFPGWKKYIGNEFYETWAESLKAAIRLGVTDWKEYHKRRYLDRKLRSDPHNHYADFVRGSEQFKVQEKPKLKPQPELFHEFKHEKEFDMCY